MKYLIILLLLFFIGSCNPKIHRDYRKMQRKVERRERRKNMNHTNIQNRENYQSHPTIKAPLSN